MKIAKGETITVGEQECIITKVSQPRGGVLDGNAKVNDKQKVTPMYRLYFKRPDGSRSHQDCIIDPHKITVECG